jgi:enoyl-CoA hydratase/carnithine racemase
MTATTDMTQLEVQALTATLDEAAEALRLGLVKMTDDDTQQLVRAAAALADEAQSYL